MLGHYLGACLVLLLLVMVPGPDFAVVARFAMTGTPGDGVRAAYGVALGLLGWGAATALGLAAPLAASAALFDAVRFLGALYLVAIGAGPEAPWLALLVATHAALSLLWLAGAATLASRGREALARPRARRIVEAIAGTALVGFGLELARGAR